MYFQQCDIGYLKAFLGEKVLTSSGVTQVYLKKFPLHIYLKKLQQWLMS